MIEVPHGNPERLFGLQPVRVVLLRQVPNYNPVRDYPTIGGLLAAVVVAGAVPGQLPVARVFPRTSAALVIDKCRVFRSRPRVEWGFQRFASRGGSIFRKCLHPALVYAVSRFRTVQRIKDKFNVTSYYRYVDDTICIIEDADNTASDILNFLNSAHPNLTYTIESETDNKLNFLDLTIEKTGQKLEDRKRNANEVGNMALPDPKRVKEEGNIKRYICPIESVVL
ncbi:hypothetical protein AAG570_007527 [Ranatra chinensis]|uniref:Reverse transcriptase domain-containing protein n=1 Tax=Ranatra chinensis TaxID=642074 RepID=A0ABD0YB90_9HEMI